MCVAGFRSMRHTRQGSWMIRALVCLLYNHSCDEDIETIFRKVSVICTNKIVIVTSRGLGNAFFLLNK